MLENIIFPYGDFVKLLDALDKWCNRIIPMNYCLFIIRDGKYLSEPMFTNDPVLPDLQPEGFLMGFEKNDTTVEVTRRSVQTFLAEMEATIRTCDKMCVGMIFGSTQGIGISTFDYMVGGSPN